MNRSTLVLSFVLAATLAASLHADPAGDLRELDRKLRAGEISQAEYDRRWSEVISAGMRSTTHVPRLPRAAARPVERPNREFSASATVWMLDSSGEQDAWAGGTALLGYFVLPALELSAGCSYAVGKLDDADTHALGGVGLIDYHVAPSARVVPYLGGGAGWARIDQDGDNLDDWYWTAHVGLKQHLTRDIALKYELGYIDLQEADARGFSFSFGVSARF